MWQFMLPAAAIGAYQGQEEAKQARKDRLAQAEVARWSPWTNMAPQQIGHTKGMLGGALGGASSGLAMSQAYDASQPANNGPVAPLDQSGELSQPVDSMTPSEPYQRPQTARYGNNPNGWSLAVNDPKYKGY